MFRKKKVAIERALFGRIVTVAAQAGYASPEEFVLHVLEKSVAHLEEAKDEEEVRKRLEGLGYIE